jgi:hypothetical protein
LPGLHVVKMKNTYLVLLACLSLALGASAIPPEATASPSLNNSWNSLSPSERELRLSQFEHDISIRSEGGNFTITFLEFTEARIPYHIYATNNFREWFYFGSVTTSLEYQTQADARSVTDWWVIPVLEFELVEYLGMEREEFSMSSGEITHIYKARFELPDHHKKIFFRIVTDSGEYNFDDHQQSLTFQ